MILFSVVIPTYNRADLIAVAINSVLSQSYQHFELTIVDNASTDNTQEIVGTFTDPRIKYIRNPKNLERCASRNIGIENSKGDYITLLDSDDYYLPNHLQTFLDEIEKMKFPEGLFFSNKIIKEQNNLNPGIFEKLTENKQEYFLFNVIIPCQVCISRSILSKHKFRSDLLIVEDAALWMTISLSFPVFQIFKETSVYLIHETNSVNVSINNAFEQRLNGLKKLLTEKEFLTSISKEKRRQVLSDCYFGIFNFYNNQNNVIKKIITISTAIVLYPEIKLKNKLHLLLSSLPLINKIVR